MYWLSEVQRGTGFDNREGRSIYPRSLIIRGKVEVNTQTTVPPDLYNNIRIMIFQWLDESTPDPFDILVNPPNTDLIPFTVWNPEYKFSYRILKDKVFTIGNYYYNEDNYGNINRPAIIPFKMKLRKFKKSCNYIASADPTDKPGWGNLFMLAIADSSAIPHPILSFTSQFNYSDN